MAAIAAVRGYATARRAAPGPSASSCTGIQLAVTALWWRRGGEFPLKSAEASAAAAACRARLKLGGCGARVRAGIELGRAPRSTAVLWQVRRYRNIWGSNSGLSTIHPDPSRPKAHDSLKAHDNLTTPGGWRLDWEEDGRWVEWRMDENGQTDDDRFRVTMEWTRFNRARGRDHTNLWEEEKTSGFNRGSSSWWREQYYEYEYTGANGISSMTAVKEACSALEVSDPGDAAAVRTNYLRLVNKWHPDRYHHHTAEEQSHAGEVFRKVQAAYELLKEQQAATR